VVTISHRPNTFGVVDKLLVLKDGAVEAFGPRNDVIARLTRLAPVQPVASAPKAQAG
jgi:ABC-type protease/lipase transport system fused ATPase/permease subunit